MKYSIFSFFLIFPLLMVAQEMETTFPKTLVGFFSYPESVDSELVKLVRKGYVNSVASHSRIECYDLAKEANISAVRLLVNKSNNDKQTISEVVAQVNADFLIEGKVTDLQVVSAIEEGKNVYAGTVSYTINVYDIKNNTIAHSESKEYNTGKYDKKDAAVKLLVDLVELTCETAVVVAPLKGSVLDMDYFVKDDKMETCYINLGGANGVHEGDYFEVKKVRSIAGRTVYSTLGRIRVEEVVDGHRSLCKVRSKGKEIYTAMKDYLKMKTAGAENVEAPVVFLVCKKGLF